MDLDLERLGQRLAQARRAKRPQLTQEDVAQALGVSRATVQNVERGSRSGKPFTRINSTMRGYCRLVGWTEGSAEEVAKGGEPTPGQAPSGEPVTPAASEAPTAPAALAGLPRRIAQELSDDGELLDTAVITLPGGGRALVVVKAGQGATPEETEEALKAWRATEPDLQELGTHRRD